MYTLHSQDIAQRPSDQLSHYWDWVSHWSSAFWKGQESIARQVIKELHGRPPLVAFDKVEQLRRQLAAAGSGRAFILQAGDCAERFVDANPLRVQAQRHLLHEAAKMLSERLHLPTLVIGRIAGQYAKSRSALTEIIDGESIPNYQGDMVNDLSPIFESRRPNPRRLLEAYDHAASTLRILGALDANEITAELVHHTYSSHEALLLDYEAALVRANPENGIWYSTSSSFLWIGERTRDPDGLHVEFASRIFNPVGLKVGPDFKSSDVERVLEKLNPLNVPGKLSLITRFGSERVADHLPRLIELVQKNKHEVVWICDPMHGNIKKQDSGFKLRNIKDIRSEVQTFFDIHRRFETVPGGLHLEVTADEVQECWSGEGELSEEGLLATTKSACDPRLNRSQTRDLIKSIRV